MRPFLFTTPNNFVIHPSTGGEFPFHSPPMEGCLLRADGVVKDLIFLINFRCTKNYLELN
jgi:hypothetical protein